MAKNEEEKITNQIGERVSNILNTDDSTGDYTKKDINVNKGMAALSYIIPPIPYFLEKNSKWVKYHAIQGMNLLVVALGYGLISMLMTSLIKVDKMCELWGIAYVCGKTTPWWVIWPLGIIGFLIGLIALIGIFNVINGKAKELPIVNKIKIFK